MQETVNWSSKLTLSRERWSGIATCYVRRVGGKHSAIQQEDSGFGVDTQENPGVPLRLDLNLCFLPGPLPHNLSHGWDSLWWLLGESMSLAFIDSFFTTEPLGKPQNNNALPQNIVV